jgi:hypothetical protein
MQSRQLLYNVQDPDKPYKRVLPWETHAGPDLTHVEDMDEEELKKHLAWHSAEEFGNFLAGRWAYYTMIGRFAGHDIAWKNAANLIYSKKDLMTAGINYYNFVLKHGAPVQGFMNSVMPLAFEGKRYSVKFPEIRKGMIIDDPTVWGFTSHLPYTPQGGDNPEGNTINNSPIVTMRILAFCNLVHDYPWVGDLKFKIPREIYNTWKGNPTWIDERVTYRHINGATGEVTETHRSDKDIDAMIKMFETYDMFRQGSDADIVPNHNYCHICPIDVLLMTGEFACDARNKNARVFVPKHMLLESNQKVTLEDIAKDADRKPIQNATNKLMRFYITNGPNWRKEVGQYLLEMHDGQGKINVKSRYFKAIRGTGIEKKLLKEMDNYLQQESDTRDMPILHTVDFDESFAGAGSRNIMTWLDQLAYDRQFDAKERYKYGTLTKLYEPGRKKNRKPIRPKKPKQIKPGKQLDLDLG